MKVSFILPHKDRTEHLRYNLDSLLAQTDSDFEVVLIDNSTNQGKLEALVAEYVGKGLDIKIYFVDILKCEFSHSIFEFQGHYNPALQQNVGVKKATGDIVVLSSPEVINAKTNVAKVKELFAGNKSQFLLGWMDEKQMQNVPPLVPDGITVEEVKRVCARTMGGASCREGDWHPLNYFIGCMLKEDFIKIGGIEEHYMAAIAFEDNCFASRCERNGFPAQLCPEVAGIHLCHGRGYQNFMGGKNHKFWDANKPLIANEGREWGRDEYVTRVYP